MSTESRHLNSEEIMILAKNGTIPDESNAWIQSHLSECIECKAWLYTMRQIEEVSPDDPYEFTEEEEDRLLDDVLKRIALLNNANGERVNEEEYPNHDDPILINNNNRRSHSSSISKLQFIDETDYNALSISPRKFCSLSWGKIYLKFQLNTIYVICFLATIWCYGVSEKGITDDDQFYKLLEPLIESIENELLTEENISDIPKPSY